MRICTCASESHRHAGDSLDGFYPPPVQLISAIQQWLRARFSGPFQDLGCSLAHPIQPDTFSCVICAGNTIAHGIFGDPLWNVQRRGLERASWFIVLEEPKTMEVRTGVACSERKSLTVMYSATLVQLFNSATAITGFPHHSLRS